jgi:hypothetical protein
MANEPETVVELEDLEDVNDARKALEEEGSISIEEFIAKYP